MRVSKQIEQIIIDSLQNSYQTIGESVSEIDLNTSILGENSVLTSVTFVFFLLDLEEKLGDITGESIVLTEHPEVFEPNGPFSSVQKLLEYISSTCSLE